MPTINRQQRGKPKRGDHQGRQFYHAGYHTTTWKSMRREILQDNPLCVECQRTGRIVVANVIDHIKPVRLGGEFFEKANLQPLCKSCHERKSAMERHGNPVGSEKSVDNGSETAGLFFSHPGENSLESL